MLFTYNSIDTTLVLFLYMFIYNISLFIVFLTLYQFINLNFKTIYSFSDLKFNFFFVIALSISLFSMAGVPPFLGFFSKLFILISLINSNFFIFYFFFFSLLFFGLYFYLQNIRFLFSTGTGKLNYSFMINLRSTTSYYLIVYIFLFFLIFGFIFLDDLILFFSWMLN